jgi:hypothetical protein
MSNRHGEWTLAHSLGAAAGVAGLAMFTLASAETSAAAHSDGRGLVGSGGRRKRQHSVAGQGKSSSGIQSVTPTYITGGRKGSCEENGV